MQLFLSVADAARILDVTPQTVRLMIRRQTIPVAAKTVGGIQLFRQKDVDHLAALRARNVRRGSPTAEHEVP
jgi:DNA-binding transcriptional MerR regulator